MSTIELNKNDSVLIRPLPHIDEQHTPFQLEVWNGKLYISFNRSYRMPFDMVYELYSKWTTWAIDNNPEITAVVVECKEPRDGMPKPVVIPERYRKDVKT